MNDSARIRSSPATTIEDGLFRALAVLRVILLANTLGFSFSRVDDYQHPAAGVACLIVITGWTAFATWAYAKPERRRHVLLGADLVLAVGLFVATPLVIGEHFRATVPGFWVAAALLAWAVRYHLLGGLAAGVILATTDLSLRESISESVYGNAFLTVVSGPIVGFMCGVLQQMATERDAAQREVVRAAERTRLARAVHDGVIQVLALVQRRGRELGGEFADLGALAGEQERSLRGLIRAEEAVDVGIAGPSVDLVAALAALGTASVTVSVPGFPIVVPAEVSRELVAVARACLDNVRFHVGTDAPAWVLVQAFSDRIELSVRDEGPGIAAGRLEKAAEEGRLGVSDSIRGRISDLGGTATLMTGSFGTEWEFVVPRVPAGVEAL